MIQLSALEVSGTSERGAFAGSLEFGPGLQIISAPNRYGKSLAFAAATWCLGVEQIYGVQAGDNGIFPEAARSFIKLGGERDVAVNSAEARLELVREDGARLRLSRAIVGGDPNQIRFDDGNTRGVLKIGYGAAQDETAGFQAHFRRWAGLPEHRLMSSRGGEYPLYLENLAPLFLIEQLRGWTDIQAEQVYRYGLIDVADGAFEYLVGLKQALEERLVRQRAISREQALHEEARFVADEVGKFFAAEGWSWALPTRGKVTTIAEKWSVIDLHLVAKADFGFDFKNQQQRLRERLEVLRAQLSSPEGASQSTGTAEASQQVVLLKERRHQLEEQIRTLRSQLNEQRSALESVEGRWSSARDLLRLKQEGVGVLPTAECPTCHQIVEPDRLRLQEQSGHVIEIHVQSLERRRTLLKNNISLLEREVIAVLAEAKRVSDDLEQAQRALRWTNQAVGATQEVAVRLATEIIDAERDLEGSRATYERINSLQEQIRSWVARASDMPIPVRTAQDEALREFLDALRENVVALGVGGVTEDDADRLRLDDHYQPLLGNRGLPTYGSASDRARLVLAYVLALLETGWQHAGFVILDEPVQQNPDPRHRALWLKFLLARSASWRHQVILFTSLRPDEVAVLQGTHLTLQAKEGKFLNLTEEGAT